VILFPNGVGADRVWKGLDEANRLVEMRLLGLWEVTPNGCEAIAISI